MADSPPFSYSFEGSKTDVPLRLDSATGPETGGAEKSKKKEVRGVARNRHGRRGKKH
jgi:hypothetical protein